MIDVQGTLYGTTRFGGNDNCNEGYGCGVVFAFDPSTGAEKTLYTFCSQQNCADGAYPVAGLINVNGTLYGTTSTGGADFGGGTVFAIDPNTGAETVLYSFCSQANCADGQQPDASLIEVKGMLYGTTYFGGANVKCVDDTYGCGTVFSVNPATGAETALYSFCSQTNCSDGAQPVASLVDAKGALYGTTTFGGVRCPDNSLGCGTVFALDLETSAETVVYSFRGNGAHDGSYPAAGLIRAKGKLYGTTADGGSGYGTVFALTQTLTAHLSCRRLASMDTRVRK